MTGCARCGRPPEAHTAPAVPDRLALATRVMRARHTSRCETCRGVILPGMSIARLIRPSGWVHTRCVPAVAAATKGK